MPSGTTRTLDRARERRRAAALARHYRDAEQLSITEIARRLGRAPATVKAYLYDPTGEKAKAVKARYRGTCRTCGADTSPRNGKGDAHAHCHRCRPGAAAPQWTRERVREAMRRWAELYGRAPSSYDWSPTHACRRGDQAMRRLQAGDWPAPATVHKLYGSWAAALADAFDAPGRARDADRERSWGADVRAVTHQVAGVGPAAVSTATTDAARRRGRAPARRGVGRLAATRCRPRRRARAPPHPDRTTCSAALAGWSTRAPCRCGCSRCYRTAASTHSVLAYVLAAALTGALIGLLDPALAGAAAAGLAIGDGAHIAADAWTRSGVLCLRRFSRRRGWLLPRGARIRTTASANTAFWSSPACCS